MNRLLRPLLLLAALLLPGLAAAQQEPLPAADLKIVTERYPTAKKTSTGLRYVTNVEGEGPTIKRGDRVLAIYVGRLLDGTVFDEQPNANEPFDIRIGRGEVIAAWEQGLQLMRKGAKMTLIAPPSLAYGTKGVVGSIPRNATLVFEITIIDVNPPARTPAEKAAEAGKK